MDYIKLKLTLPPSVNGLYAGMTRRYKAPKYKEWINIAQRELLTQDKGKITGSEWLEVNIGLYTKIYNKNGTKKKKDIDNYFKATFDFLGDNIEGFDDSKIKRLRADKFQSQENYMIISIRELNEKM